VCYLSVFLFCLSLSSSPDSVKISGKIGVAKFGERGSLIDVSLLSITLGA